MKENKLFEEHQETQTLVSKSYYRDFFAVTLTKLSFVLPTIMILLLFIIGFIFCHFFNIERYLEIDMTSVFIPPCFKYPFGTNGSGQNQFYLVFIGVYKTLLLSFVATFINLILGIIIGIFWGVNKKADSLFLTLKNILDNTPLIFFYVILVTIMGDGFIPLLIVIILFGWLDFAFIIRNNLQLINSKDYNKVSMLYNIPLYKRAINNYLPSILPILFNNIALCIPKMIALEIMISYFGFSFGNSYPSLGMLIYSTISNSTYFTNPHMFLIPFIFLFIINICVYFISKTISENFLKEKI